jgi:hypothetical protein
MIPAVSFAIEGDRARGLAYRAAAMQLYERVRLRMASSSLESLRAHQGLAEDAYCYVVVARGLASVRVVVGPGAARPESAWVSEDWKTPDFLSGVVIGGRIVTSPEGRELCDEFWPTPECGRLFKLYAVNQTGPILSKRLAVQPHQGLAGAYPEFLPGYVPSQYAALQPTLWTGRMRQVVQFLMGGGIPNARSIYSGRAWKEDPNPDNPAPAAKKVPNPYEQEVAAQGRQIRYDFRWFRTHGITRGSDGTLWLVEISLTRGVVAMPLPIYAETQAPEFRDRVEKLNDSAGRAALDGLGGFPSGESFPTGEKYAAFVRAGKIIPLLSAGTMRTFYNNQSYSSVMGWAFSDSGQEAHNTAWQYGDDHIIRGYHYAVRLHFGLRRAEERTIAAAKALGQPYLALADQYPDKIEASMWKLRYLSDEQVDDIERTRAIEGTRAAFLALDALELAPLASASAGLSLQGQGKLYSPARPQFQPQLKFPEPALGCLVSFDLRPEIPLHNVDVACDTPVHVFFLGENLQVWKFYSPGRRASPKRYTTLEPCMYVGAWEDSLDSGTFVPALFYSNQIDPRREVADTESSTRIDGKDLGFLRAYYGDDLANLHISYMYRERWFQLHTVTESKGGPRLKNSLLVPFGDRAACYYAELDGYADYSYLETWYQLPVTDPNYAQGYRKLYRFWSDEIPECGNSDYRRAQTIGYAPSGCSDVADDGPWISKCNIFESMVYDNPRPPMPAPISILHQSPFTLRVKLIADYPESPLLVVEEKRDHDPNNDGGVWFAVSPDSNGFAAYLFTTHNAFGDNQVIQYFSEINGGVVLRGGPVHPDMLGRRVCFVGVNS